ncbi:MAG: hypothetical protein JWN76_908 [Chitinophagaceae bacterium]|nr:hypothetical protein [Chitinophagaceae bacterium]
MHNLTWGKDIIFTYGPLGFLSIRNGFGVSRWIFIFFDLFIVINFFYVFKDYLLRSGDLFISALILIATCLLIGSFYGSAFSWILLFLICYRMYTSYLHPSILSLALLSILIALSFFIKMNTGLVGIIFLSLHLLNLFFIKKITALKATGVFVLAIGVIILLASLLHVSLSNYVRGSLELISGYNQVMYLEEMHEQTEWNVKMLLAGILLLFSIQAALLIKQKQYSRLLYTISCVGYLFLLWKQSIVRNDIQHLQEFLFYAPLILITGNFFSDRIAPSRFFSGATLVIVVAALLIKAETVPVNTMVNTRFFKKKEYLHAFREYDPANYLGQQNKRLIPDSLVKKIGTHTIDVFPWDAEYLFQHHMNYSPRPVFQSYTAYTDWLEKKNLEHYQKKAPDFLLYDYDAIDGRYPFNEEVLTNFFITKNYHVTDTFTSNERQRILLEKNSPVMPLHFVTADKKNAETSDEVPVNNFSFIKIKLAYSLRGKLRATLYKAPPVYISFILQNGERHLYKTSIDLLETGIMTDKLVISDPDFIHYIRSKENLPGIARIKLELEQRYFKKIMTVEYLQVAP